jgi:hypothetical protein
MTTTNYWNRTLLMDSTTPCHQQDVTLNDRTRKEAAFIDSSSIARPHLL